MAESKMPAKIWTPSESAPYSTPYIRADLVEPLAEALRRIADPRNIHFAGDAQVVAARALQAYEARIKSALVEAPAVKGEPEPVAWPANLNPRTLDLVQRFALALAKKLRLAEEKYGHTDGWLRDDWEAECRDHLYQHLEKGDPRDVAAYCAFMWHHDWITCRPVITAPPADAGMREAYSALCLPRENQASDNLEGALYDIERLSAQGKPADDVCIRTLNRVLKQIVRAEDALTAPGATTKSDGGVSAASGNIILPPKDFARVYSAISAAKDVLRGYAKIDYDADNHPQPNFAFDVEQQCKEAIYTLDECNQGFPPSQTSPSDPSSTRSDRWVCAARQRSITLDPQDCDWPVCGCDPLANKVLDTIAESGFVIVPKDGAPMTDDQIKHMVDRFLGWTLPENFNPDGGVSFKRLENRHHHPDASPFYPMPVGTNLFDAVQATAMVRHMLDGLPSSTRSDVTVRWRSLPAGLFVDPTQGLMIRFEDKRHRKATVAEKEVMLRALRGADFPDDLRVPLHELQADVGYLVGRVVADSSCAPAIAAAIRAKLSVIEQAARALLDQFEIRRK